MSHLPSQDFVELSELQEEATYEVVGRPRPPPPADYQLSASAAYEVVDQPRPPPPADYQLSVCTAYAHTDFNTENK